MSTTEKIAVVTGGNKGIGFAVVRAICKEFDGVVYLTSRDSDRGLQAVDKLKAEGLNPRFHQLDIDNLESIQNFRDFIKSTHGGIDILVNNAAIAFKHAAPEPFGEQAEVTHRVNYFGVLNTCNELFPLLRKHARVVNLSSSLGHLSRVNGKEPEATEKRKQLADPTLTVPQLTDMVNEFVRLAKEGKHVDAGYGDSAYAMSKVVVAALTRIQQRELDETRPDDDIIVNSVHPGYVDTDMTSHKGPLSIDEGAIAPAFAALLPPNAKEPRGGYIWCDKTITDWVNGPCPSV